MENEDVEGKEREGEGKTEGKSVEM